MCIRDSNRFIQNDFYNKIIDKISSSQHGYVEILKQSFRCILFLTNILVFNSVPRFQPKLHLLQTDEVVLAHSQLPTNRIYLIFLHIPALSQTNPHLVESYHAFTRNLGKRLWLSLPLYQPHDLLDLTLSQLRKVVLFEVLQLHYILYLFR